MYASREAVAPRREWRKLIHAFPTRGSEDFAERSHEDQGEAELNAV